MLFFLGIALLGAQISYDAMIESAGKEAADQFWVENLQDLWFLLDDLYGSSYIY